MGDDEHRDLWAAVHQIKAESAATNTAVQSALARIEAMLGERCEARVARIKDIEDKQDQHDARIGRLEELRAQILLLAALGSMVGGGAVVFLFRVLGE